MLSITTSARTLKPVEGFPGYQVGDDGTVWSCWKPFTNGSRMTEHWKEIRGGIDKDGYHKVILCKDGARRYARVHILILETFIGPCPIGMEAAHENGVRADCRLTNLRWDTHQSNVADKKRHGTHQSGTHHGMSKLTADGVREIRARRAAGEKLSAIAKDFNLRIASVGNIVARRTWKDV